MKRCCYRLPVFIMVTWTILWEVPSLGAPPVDRVLSTQVILSALRASHVLSHSRKVLEAERVCDLSIDGQLYPVIKLVEKVAAAQSSRAYRRALLMKPSLEKAFELPYDPPAEPISCDGNVLSFSHAVEIGNTLPAGRRVAFANGGTSAKVLQGEAR
jgi:hypothetical protein